MKIALALCYLIRSGGLITYGLSMVSLYAENETT